MAENEYFSKSGICWKLIEKGIDSRELHHYTYTHEQLNTLVGVDKPYGHDRQGDVSAGF